MTGCLNKHVTHVISNNSTNYNVVFFFFVLDLKVVYYNNYFPSIIMPWPRKENIFCDIGDKIYSKLS